MIGVQCNVQCAEVSAVRCMCCALVSGAGAGRMGGTNFALCATLALNHICTEALLHCNIIALQHCSTIAMQNYGISIALNYHSTTALQH